MFLYQVLVMAHVKRWWLGRNRRALKTIVQRDMWAPLIDNDADAAAVDRCHRDAPDAWSNSKAWTYIDGGEQGDGDGYDDDCVEKKVQPGYARAPSPPPFPFFNVHSATRALVLRFWA